MLKPCPFCGRRDAAIRHGIETMTAYVRCPCVADGPAFGYEFYAKKAWNHRAKPRRKK